MTHLVRIAGALACSAVVASPAAAAPPPNDQPPGATNVNAPGQPLVSTSIAGTNVEATRGGDGSSLTGPGGSFVGEPIECYSDFGVSRYGATVWYALNADVPGRLTLTVRPTGVLDTVVRLIPLNASGEALTDESVCVDEGGFSGADNLPPLSATPRRYLVQIGGFDPDPFNDPPASQGSFTLDVGFARDSDSDGVLDVDDACPALPGPIGGCPDSDGDGVVDPLDACPNEDASARDADRDGCLDIVRLRANAAITFAGTRNGIRVRSFKVTRVARGAQVVVTCSRKACPRTALTAQQGGTRSVVIAKLKGRRLRKGTRIRVRVTRARSIGRYIAYMVRRGGFKKVERCLPVGSSKPRKRCRTA